MLLGYLLPQLPHLFDDVGTTILLEMSLAQTQCQHRPSNFGNAAAFPSSNLTQLGMLAWLEQDLSSIQSITDLLHESKSTQV